MLCILTVAMMGSLDDPKDEAPARQEKKIITTQAEFKKSLDTGSWGTSCLSPGFCHRVLAPVCLRQAKLSLKSGLAEVNIVHLHSGHDGEP